MFTDGDIYFALLIPGEPMEPFPCDHYLRQYAKFSLSFEHCECRYSDWTEWTIPENATSIVVPSNQCRSEMAWPEERWQEVISGYKCKPLYEERHICKSILDLLLTMLL